jgi:hypothetical protein
MNLRQQTNTLGSTDIRRLEAAKYNAEKIGRPLNCFATFNPRRGGGRDNGKAILHSSGRIGSTFNYMTKQMDSQARYARCNRVRAAPPGPFTGRRFGMTANIFVSATEIEKMRAIALAQRAAA